MMQQDRNPEPVITVQQPTHNDQMKDSQDQALNQFASQVQDLDSKLKRLESNHKDLDNRVILKLKEVDLNMKKQLEDGEGRDGLILQQNQDISSLFENDKSFNVQIEELSEKTDHLEAALGQYSTNQMVNDQL